MTKNETRLLFLRQFTQELIKNSALQIYIPHFKQKSQQIQVPILQPMPQIQPQQVIQPSIIHKPAPILRIKPSAIAKVPVAMPPPIQPVQITQASLPQNFLGRLNFLISDPRVTIIECPGPEKLVLARASGQTALTKIALTKDEIQSIIQAFSNEAKIPVIPGLFKAAVSNLILTAVISDIVGSRFIITKMTPQFFLEQT